MHITPVTFIHAVPFPLFLITAIELADPLLLCPYLKNRRCSLFYKIFVISTRVTQTEKINIS